MSYLLWRQTLPTRFHKHTKQYLLKVWHPCRTGPTSAYSGIIKDNEYADNKQTLTTCAVPVQVKTTVPATDPLSGVQKPRYVGALASSVIRGAAAVPDSPDPLPGAPKYPPPQLVSLQMVQLLEKLSLVDVATMQGVKALNHTIRLAARLQEVDTKGVEPLITVLENRYLRLSSDTLNYADSGNDGMERRDALLHCASEMLEGYFVMPPGNINYTPSEGYYRSLMDSVSGSESRNTGDDTEAEKTKSDKD